MNFAVWFESKQFERLIPKEVLALVPRLKKEAEELTKAYFKDKSSVKPYSSFAKIPDPFFPSQMDVAFLTIEEWNKRGYPSSQGISSDKPFVNNERVVYYRIPMTDYSTIYHELVHAYDPKIGKGLSPNKKINGMQDNRTPHELDAHLSGHIDMMKQMLREASPEQSNKWKAELKNWLNDKTRYDDEPYFMPQLLKGVMVDPFRKNQKLWRKFVSSIYNAVFGHD